MDQYAELIPIEKIDFDLTNPRIAHIFENDPDTPPSPDEISRALREESSDSLRRSIKQTKGIKNPIKVSPINNDRYRVFEGNTRLSIYKSFQFKGEPGNWESIPAVIYGDINQGDIDEILIQDHIVGTQPWSAYAKARYLHHLHFEKGLTIQSIAAMCGIGDTEILHSLDTFIFMNKFYRKIVEQEELHQPTADPYFNERRYTAFQEYIKNDNRSNAVDLAGYTDEDFSRWIAEGLFVKNEDVRVISDILSNEPARNAFLKYGTKEAKKLLDTPAISSQLQEATMVSLCKAITEKTRNIQAKEIETIKENQTSSMVVFDALAVLESFHKVYIEEK